MFIIKYILPKNRQSVLLLVAILSMVSITVLADFLGARSRNGAFYLSESLLFSSFWLLFFPLLHGQRRLISLRPGISLPILLFTIPLMVIIHLLVYPAQIFFLSLGLLEYGFAYRQTFDFSISFYLLSSVLIYAVLPVVSLTAQPNMRNVDQEHLTNIDTNPDNLTVSVAIPSSSDLQQFPGTMLVPTSNNKSVVIELSEVLYFSAATPYVAIYRRNGKLLFTGTLKNLASKLNPALFSRIHKTTIVNISQIKSLRSRSNGDYDLEMSDGSCVRMSRNYAAAFKAVFEAGNLL